MSRTSTRLHPKVRAGRKRPTVHRRSRPPCRLELLSKDSSSYSSATLLLFQLACSGSEHDGYTRTYSPFLSRVAGVLPPIRGPVSRGGPSPCPPASFLGRARHSVRPLPQPNPHLTPSALSLSSLSHLCLSGRPPGDRHPTARGLPDDRRHARSAAPPSSARLIHRQPLERKEHGASSSSSSILLGRLERKGEGYMRREVGRERSEEKGRSGSARRGALGGLSDASPKESSLSG